MAKADRVHSTPPLNSSSIERANHLKPVRSPWIRFPINPVSDSPKAKTSPVSPASPPRGYHAGT
jgi:hypothetical protein